MKLARLVVMLLPCIAGCMTAAVDQLGREPQTIVAPDRAPERTPPATAAIRGVLIGPAYIADVILAPVYLVVFRNVN